MTLKTNIIAAAALAIVGLAGAATNANAAVAGLGMATSAKIVSQDAGTQIEQIRGGRGGGGGGFRGGSFKSHGFSGAKWGPKPKPFHHHYKYRGHGKAVFYSECYWGKQLYKGHYIDRYICD